MSLNIEDAAEQSRGAGESDLIKYDRQLYGLSLYPIGDTELAALLRQTVDALDGDRGELANRLAEVVGEITIRVRGEEIKNAGKNNKAPECEEAENVEETPAAVASSTQKSIPLSEKIVPGLVNSQDAIAALSQILKPLDAVNRDLIEQQGNEKRYGWICC